MRECRGICVEQAWVVSVAIDYMPIALVTLLVTLVTATDVTAPSMVKLTISISLCADKTNWSIKLTHLGQCASASSSTKEP